MSELTNADIEAARSRGLDSSTREARALSAHYQPASGMLAISLRGGSTLHVPALMLQGVAGASDDAIAAVEVVANGAGLHWETLDADLLVQGIVAGSFGTVAWMAELESRGLLDTAAIHRMADIVAMHSPTAAEIGRKGGSVSSEAKRLAVRRNGIKGGRPRKQKLVA